MSRPEPLISLCLIAGNVEEYIARCLESFAPIADEIIVVRAIGNAWPDRTLDIAREKFGAITGEYRNASGHEDWPHVDNFAAARNFAFALATGRYWFWADTDDVLKSGAELIREHAERAEYPLLILPYEIFGRGVTVPRERLILRGTPGKWKYPVHESFQFEMEVPAASDDRIVVQHLPKPSKTGSIDRNLRILTSIPEAEMTPGLWFHLHQEHKAAGQIAKAIDCAKKALSSPDIGQPEKYELLCDLARMSAHRPELSGAYLHQAFAADPCRREALGMLSATAIDLGRNREALAYARQMMATERPAQWSWNDRQSAYGWLGLDILQQALRANGQREEAEAIRQQILATEVQRGPIISLLHATRGRPRQASIARKKWLDLAEHPERIEHIFAIDADDRASDPLRRFHHLELDGTGGCVAAWNAAAGESIGQVLVQLSDDWTPPAKWDTLILERLNVGTEIFDVEADVDGSRQGWTVSGLQLPRVLAIHDGHRTDDLLCMAICTRAYFLLDYFLFHPWFTGVYSDNWFTQRAQERGAIVDARDFVFDHDHPAFKADVPMDETYARQNATQRYEEGRAVLSELFERADWSTVPGFFNYWPWYQQIARTLQDGDTFIEVGVWMGRSLIYLVQECLRLGKTGIRFVAIDTFVGEQDQPAHSAIVAEHGGSLRATFEANLERCGVAGSVTIIEGDSAESAAAFADGSIAGIFIDAAHDYESVRRDVAAWMPKVCPGGILSGHDAQHEPVQRAVTELIPDARRIGCIWTR